MALGLGLAAVGYEDGGAGVGVDAEGFDDAVGVLAGGIHVMQVQRGVVGDGLFEGVPQVLAMFGEVGISKGRGRRGRGRRGRGRRGRGRRGRGG